MDGYQALSHEVYARDNQTTRIDLRIGGSGSNVRAFETGWLFGGSPSHLEGHRAFFILHEMTDHRIRMAQAALDDSDFTEKEVLFPSGLIHGWRSSRRTQANSGRAWTSAAPRRTRSP